MKRYIIRWADDRDRRCVLTMTNTLADDGDTGEMELLPSDTPFVTSTTPDTNPLTPVRGQTGKVGFIAADGFSIVPANDHQWRVVLRRESESRTMWTGWLKSETYNQRLWGVNEGVTLNVIDDVEALKTWTLDADKGFGMVSLRELICECLDHVNGVAGHDTLELEWSMDVSPTIGPWAELFDMKVSRYNFFSQVADSAAHEGKTCHAVLESICKTFGWTLTMVPHLPVPGKPLHDGVKMLFSYAGAKNYMRVSYSFFKSGEWTDQEESSPSVKAIEDLQPCNLHDYSIEPGYRKVKVVSQLKLVNNLLPPLGIDNSNVKDVWSFEVDYQRNGTHGKMDWRVRLLEPKDARTEFPKYTLSGGVTGTPVPFYGAITEDNFDRVGYYGIYPISHDYWGGPEEDPGSAEKKEDKINYSWSELYLVRCMDIADNTHPLLIAHGEGHCLYGNGGFEIGLQLHVQDSYDVDPGVNIIMTGAERGGVYGPIKRGWQIRDGGTNNPRVVMLLRVGDKWWNGESWESERSTFSVTIWGQQAFQYNHEKTNKVLDWKFNATHYAIPINTTLQGDTEFQIIKVDYGSASYVYNECLMTGLTLNYCEAEDERKTNSDGSHEYSHTADGWTTDAEGVTLDICSDKNDAANYSVLTDKDGKTVKSVWDALTEKHQRPEEALLDKLKAHMTRAREILTLRYTLADGMEPKNRFSIGEGENRKVYSLLAVKDVDWCSGDAELVLSREPF